MRTIAILGLAASTLISLTWGYHEHRLAGQLRQEKTRLLAQQAEAETTVADLRDRLERQQHAAMAMRSQAQTASSMAIRPQRKPLGYGAMTSGTEKMMQAFKAGFGQGAAAGQEGASDAEKAAPGKGMMAEVAKMMKNNPEMKKMIQAQQKAMMDITYGSMFDLLNLPPEKLTAFKDLLAKKQNAAMDIGFEMLDNSLTDEQKKAKGKEMTALTAQTDKEVKELLGKDNYELYKAYEETQAERMQVNMFNKSLASDLQLNDVQQNDLVFALHKARSEFKFTTGLENQKSMPDPSKFTTEQFDKFMEENRQLNAQYIQIAGKMLTPEQAAKFQSSLEQQQAMQELGIKMMFGGGSGTKTPGTQTKK